MSQRQLNSFCTRWGTTNAALAMWLDAVQGVADYYENAARLVECPVMLRKIANEENDDNEK